MKCQNCGHELKKGDVFCTECGAKVPDFNQTVSKLEFETGAKGKNKKKVLIISGIVAVLVLMLVGCLVLFVWNKNDSSIGSDQPKHAKEKLVQGDYPSKELLNDGFYMNYETDFSDLLGNVQIFSWKVSMADSETVLFELEYQTDTEYDVVCFNNGQAESFSTLYESNGSTYKIFPNESVMTFRVPKDVYLNTLNEEFRIIITSDQNIGSDETGVIYTVGKSGLQANTEEGSDIEEIQEYLVNIVLIPQGIMDSQTGYYFEEIRDEGDGYVFGIRNEQGGSIGWFQVNKTTWQVTNYVTGEIIG